MNSDKYIPIGYELLHFDKRADDLVSHPAHYCDGGIETIDFIEAKQLNFCRGCAVKYISRAGKKDKSAEIQDLQKAIWYLQHEINKLEKIKTE